MATIKLDRAKLRQLLKQGHTVRDLAVVFRVSREYCAKYIAGAEPRHPGVTLWINHYANKLLAQK